ncbi:MAG: glucosamine-fructose-6-phosphate aminotransferase [Edafosvirus sp.]|uniref:glutamine--fructose-6-phosphate transaminase (isomerizing) n=1 Tax=Edafosvirus sp. TaxID=2487765 RepID=A0A3G4ZWL6_9VIRU|nr:MAG: glucosamine-fructose-6-phosphate aminotransferase [Edafosvirus sp.]
MCGIIGYLGSNAQIDLCINGLKMLLNRGYDSVGCASIKNNNIICHKYASDKDCNSIDKLIAVKNEFMDTTLNILHCRWATNGAKTIVNAHPHIDMNNLFALVHNGIIDNCDELRNDLISEGYKFNSQTDTEVIVNLISYNYAQMNNVENAIKTSMDKLKGTYALAIIYKNNPDTLYCVKKISPLLIGISSDFVIVASEISGFYNSVHEYISLNDDELCIINCSNKNNKIKIISKFEYKRIKLDNQKYYLSPKPFDHWTIKEIYDQPELIKNTLINSFCVKELDNYKESLSDIDNIILLGCGTSYHACMQGAYFFKKYCYFNTVQSFDGAEFTHKDIPRNGKTVAIFISQSGETRDLFRCIEYCKNLFTIGMINVPNSQIGKLMNCCINLNAGREVGVASTKSFTAQILNLMILSIWFAQHKVEVEANVMGDIANLSNDVEKILNMDRNIIKDIAHYLLNQSTLFILGKGQSTNYAYEGALKIKEITGLHAEAYNSSALKHGSYSLINGGTPIILIILDDENYVHNNNIAEEILARYGYIISITDQPLIKNKYSKNILIPKNKNFGGLLAVIVMQLIAYELAILKNMNPDYPKNLAKCVTVE